LYLMKKICGPKFYPFMFVEIISRLNNAHPSKASESLTLGQHAGNMKDESRTVLQVELQ